MARKVSLINTARIENIIQYLRGQKVILSFHLADMYGIQSKALVQAVKRNLDRFPKDFMSQLTASEWGGLRSQFVTLNHGSGKGPKYLPYAFTEQGVAVLSSVLNSPRAIEVNIEIVRPSSVCGG